MVSHDDLTSYLEQNGWRHGTPGAYGALWAIDGSEPVGITNNLSAESPDWSLALEQLAFAWKRGIEELRRDLSLLHTDEIEFAAPGDGGGIGLKAGAALFTMARRAVRATASTAASPRPAIRGNFLAAGEKVTQQVLFGHTRVGSYVVPVQYQLDPILTYLAQATFEGMADVAKYSESVQRRASRTLMQSLDFVARQIVEPGQDPSHEVLIAGVETGVSRELVDAVREVFQGNDDLPVLTARATWAGLASRPLRPTNPVVLDSASADLLSLTSKKLGEMKPLQSESISGPVAGVAPVDPLADRAGGVASTVQVQAVRNGRSCRVKVVAAPAQWHEINEWLHSGEIVIAHGTVKRLNGELTLANASQLRPLGQIMLPVE